MEKVRYVKLRGEEIYCWVCSILVVLAMNCKMECIDGGRDSALLNGMYKLRNSFYSYNFTDVFIMVTIIFLIRYVRKQGMVCDKWIKIFSLIFSVSYVVSLSYAKYDSAAFLFEDRFQMLLSIVCIIGYYIIIQYSLCLLIMGIESAARRPVSQDSTDKFFHRHMWLVAFLIIFLCWLPWILMNYPGTDEPDSIYQMQQYFGDAAFNAHHPPLSTFVMGILFVIGRFIWNANFGFFLYIFLQTFLGALIFSWSINEIHKLGIRCKYCLIAVLYYALLPIWGGTMQGDGKDILYAESVALFVTCMVKIIVARQCGKKESFFIVVSGILAALLRNNGIYAVLPTILIMLFYLRNVERKKMCVVLIIVTLFYYGVTNLIYPSMGIEKGSVREALSIPFLQTAVYVNTYEDEVTEYEKEVIESVLNYDALKTYNPKNADSVKNTYKEDNSKLPEYFKIWFQMFIKHPISYVSTFVNCGGGYFAPVMTGFPAPIGDKSSLYFAELGVEHVFGNKFSDFFVEIEYACMELPVIKYFCMSGTYTWLILCCIMLLLREKMYSGLILFVPEIMNVLVCIASPTWHIRYMLPVMAVVPLMIGWTYYLVACGKSQNA